MCGSTAKDHTEIQCTMNQTTIRFREDVKSNPELPPVEQYDFIFGGARGSGKHKQLKTEFGELDKVTISSNRDGGPSIFEALTASIENRKAINQLIQWAKQVDKQINK